MAVGVIGGTGEGRDAVAISVAMPPMNPVAAVEARPVQARAREERPPVNAVVPIGGPREEAPSRKAAVMPGAAAVSVMSMVPRMMAMP